MKRKFMWKTLAIFMMVCTLVQTVGAVDVKKSQQSTEIVFEGKIDKEKAELITATFSGKYYGVIPGYAICGVQGHITVKDSILETIHHSPRCFVRYYEIEYCPIPDCGYIMYSMLYEYVISCCP